MSAIVVSNHRRAQVRGAGTLRTGRTLLEAQTFGNDGKGVRRGSQRVRVTRDLPFDLLSKPVHEPAC
jgi:hypothetical protein